MAETRVAPGDPTLHARLHQAVEGEVRFDAFTRGLYATDASHYQIEPLGVVFPRRAEGDGGHADAASNAPRKAARLAPSSSDR